MSPMTHIMIGFMILIMVGFMFLVMRVLHSIRSIHGRQNTASARRTSGAISVIHQIITLLLRAGIRVSILGPLMLLTVRGRKTGQPRTIPVDLHEYDGRRFLIATHGEGNWVHNLRAAGEGSLGLGRSYQAFTARELSPEAGGPVIRAVLGPLLASSGIRGSTLRDHLGLTPNSSLDDFIDVARSHPVFELSFPHEASIQS